MHACGKDTKQLNVELQLEGEVTTYDGPEDVWATVQADDGHVAFDVVKATVEAVSGRIHPHAGMGAGPQVHCRAVPDDPRWQNSRRSTAGSARFPRLYSLAELWVEPKTPVFWGSPCCRRHHGATDFVMT